MCRLYGFLANEATKVECSLVHAQNALLHQSRSDLRGEAHQDGWGIACYCHGVPRLERRATAAHQDIWFSLSAERTYSQAVIAHIRKATVGTPKLVNTHPFTYQQWTFAHNGTVPGFTTLQPMLMQDIRAELLTCRRGETDSELVFYWILEAMLRAGVPLDQTCKDSDSLVPLMGNVVHQLDTLSRQSAPNKTPRLNLLLTNGQLLLGIRWNHSLYFVERKGIHDCEVCGIPHIRHQTATPYHAVVLASEPISHEDWHEVPNHSVVLSQDGSDLRTFSISKESTSAVPSSS